MKKSNSTKKSLRNSVKYTLFRACFLFFAFLADKSGGKALFVRPKMLFGTLILGLGINSCNQLPPQQPTCYEPLPADSVEEVSCYKMETTPEDTVKTKNRALNTVDIVSCYEIVDIADLRPSCYVQIAPNIPIAPPKLNNDTTQSYRVVENFPEFPGGMEKLYELLRQELHYPNMEISGNVFIEFVVEQDGSISNPKVLHSLHPDFDYEAVRALLAMPKWKPAIQQGKPVRCYFRMPIRFSLQ